MKQACGAGHYENSSAQSSFLVQTSIIKLPSLKSTPFLVSIAFSTSFAELKQAEPLPFFHTSAAWHLGPKSFCSSLFSLSSLGPFGVPSGRPLSQTFFSGAAFFRTFSGVALPLPLPPALPPLLPPNFVALRSAFR